MGNRNKNVRPKKKKSESFILFPMVLNRSLVNIMLNQKILKSMAFSVSIEAY